jgi:hypothetical protein
VTFETFPGRFGLLVSLVCTIQLFGIPFNRLHPIVWHSQYGQWITDLASKLLPMSSASSFIDGTLLQTALFGERSPLYAIWALMVVFIFLMIVVVMLRKSRYQSWNGLLLRLSNIIFYFLTSIAFLPIMSLFGSLVTCHDHDSNATMVRGNECWSGSHLNEGSLSILSALALLAMGVIRSLFLLETIAYDGKYLSKAHGRLDAVETVIYGVLIFLTSGLSGVMQDRTNIRWIFNIICVVGTCAVAVLHLTFHIHYVMGIQVYKVVTRSVLAWCCIAVVVLELFPTHGYEGKNMKMKFKLLFMLI